MTTIQTVPQTVPPTTARLTGRHRLRRRTTPARRGLATVSMFAAAGAAGWYLATIQGQPAPAPQPAAGTAPAQQIQRQGEVVTVNGDSLTTATADGRVTTFRITPQTTQITGPGVATPYTAGSFAPDQDVVVVGVLDDGTPVATAVADQRMVGPGGAPMDYGLPT